jgi:hypothetical protein
MLTIRTRLTGSASTTDRQQIEVFWFKLELLLEGARRHARPFGLTRFGFTRSHDSALFLAENRERVRACDAIVEIADAVIVAWEDADRDIAGTAASRLLLSTTTCCPVDVTTAAFPENGLTISALFAALQEADEPVHRLRRPAGLRAATPPLPWEEAGTEERAS